MPPRRPSLPGRGQRLPAAPSVGAAAFSLCLPLGRHATEETPLCFLSLSLQVWREHLPRARPGGALPAGPPGPAAPHRAAHPGRLPRPPRPVQVMRAGLLVCLFGLGKIVQPPGRARSTPSARAAWPGRARGSRRALDGQLLQTQPGQGSRLAAHPLLQSKEVPPLRLHAAQPALCMLCCHPVAQAGPRPAGPLRLCPHDCRLGRPRWGGLFGRYVFVVIRHLLGMSRENCGTTTVRWRPVLLRRPPSRAAWAPVQKGAPAGTLALLLAHCA